MRFYPGTLLWSVEFRWSFVRRLIDRVSRRWEKKQKIFKFFSHRIFDLDEFSRKKKTVWRDEFRYQKLAKRKETNRTESVSAELLCNRRVKTEDEERAENIEKWRKKKKRKERRTTRSIIDSFLCFSIIREHIIIIIIIVCRFFFVRTNKIIERYFYSMYAEASASLSTCTQYEICPHYNL